MKSGIVHSNAPIVLVGAGSIKKSVLLDALQGASRIVAADGGAAQVLDLGFVPEAVIGDMDSLPLEVQAQLPAGVLHPIAEQESTDFDKALRNINAPLVLGYGFLGARLDHQLACMTVLARRPDRRCVLVGEEDAIVLAPPELALDLPEGTRVSLFPMASVEGTSEGLHWPIDELAFAPDDVVGTSNRVTGPVRLTMTGPGMLLILPRVALPALCRGLAQSRAEWPARA
ncbi:MAG: thiamine diphosphokinase [Paracoccaceae bacterium]|nr:thiamine diphosphokinase [Paracoccaceae bacterium]